MFGLALERLQLSPTTVLVGGDGAFRRRHAQCTCAWMANLGREFALALGARIQADGSVEVLVTRVVGELCCCLSRLGDGRL